MIDLMGENFPATRANGLFSRLLLGVAALAACQLACGDVLSTARLVFPAQTESVEYDNLLVLRRLPNYAALRQRFAGEQLDDVKASLRQVGISENQIQEVAMGTSPAGFYGLLGGSFSAALATKAAQRRGFAAHAIDGHSVFCPKADACLVFLEEALVGFGTLNQLKTMLHARQGVVPRLSSNRGLTSLLDKTDPHAPVRGVVSGSQLTVMLADALQDQSGLQLDWATLASNIRAFGYSVNIDKQAHVSATLECKSAATAALLRQTLCALGSLQSVATSVGKDPASMPFQNLRLSSSGSIIDLKVDTPVPAA